MIVFRKAVLIIHGFAGGTYDQEELAFFLEKNPLIDVYQITLPGHNKRSFKSVKYKEWIEYAEKKLNDLIKYGYKNIYLIGHSMGGVIATYLSNKYPQVKKLVLAAPAFNYISMNKDDSLEFLKGSVNLIKTNDKDEIISRFFKLPISSLNEFKKIVEEHKNDYKMISVPVLIIHGKNDSVVPPESSKKMYDEIPVSRKKIILLDNAGHDLFSNVNKETLKSIENFLIY